MRLVRVVTSDGWFIVVGLLHTLEQTQVVEEADQLVGFYMTQAIAPTTRQSGLRLQMAKKSQRREVAHAWDPVKDQGGGIPQ